LYSNFKAMKISQAIFAGSSTRVAQKPARRLPEFAFIGRSNVGKSSLINMLTGNRKLAQTSATPGKTKVVNHFLINDSWYLVDLPGYGYAKLPAKMREELAEVIRQFIMESPDLVMLFVLIDSRHDIGAVDLGFLSELGEHGIPFAIIFTKADKMGPVALQQQIDRDRAILSQTWEELPPMLVSSSQNHSGKEEILDYINTILNSL
jgi:GTP-binding protein